jgi:cytochrome oxidase Cu insertion factor (SCO1/SenC/PrrC family)
MTDVRPRGRKQLLLLTALFFAPLLAALLLYFLLPDWRPQTRTNYGTLVTPARPLPDLPLLDQDGKPIDEHLLLGRWIFLYAGGESCDQGCEEKLHQIRQIRTLLNEKRSRVLRVYLAPDAAALSAAHTQLAAENPDLAFITDEAAQGALREFFAPQQPQALYLIDPLGNWLMVYDGKADSRGILKDIKRLLRVSQIG